MAAADALSDSRRRAKADLAAGTTRRIASTIAPMNLSRNPRSSPEPTHHAGVRVRTVRYYIQNGVLRPWIISGDSLRDLAILPHKKAAAANGSDRPPIEHLNGAQQ